MRRKSNRERLLCGVLLHRSEAGAGHAYGQARGGGSGEKRSPRGRRITALARREALAIKRKIVFHFGSPFSDG